jgi:ribosomal protein L11 methyltransferase
LDYIEITFIIPGQSLDLAEIIIAGLSEIGFESFFENDQSLYAYIPRQKFDEKNFSSIPGKYNILPEHFIHTSKIIPDQNWNTLWESNFEPISIDNYCVVRAPFHKQYSGFKHSITIEPKMSFGTGHHETTWLMMKRISTLEIEGKKILDMGCGTSILAILASLEGAESVKAIDNDPWAYNNSIENICKNNIHNITVILGDSKSIKGDIYDIIFANINRNVLLSDMHNYSNSVVPGGYLVMSGFYVDDLKAIQEEAGKNGLDMIDQMEKNKWVAAVFGKIQKDKMQD